MRQTILAAAAVIGFAVVGSAPAMACGYTPCGTPAYAYPSAYAYPPAYPYQAPYACGNCGYTAGYTVPYTYERLAEPDTQYYYVNQGPTYTGPGRFAPYPTYHESAVVGYAYPRHHHHYYAGAGVAGPAVYAHGWHRHGWGQAGYYHGRRVLRRYD